MAITKAQINKAIRDQLVFPNVVTQGHNELTEAIAETPAIQVYFNSVTDHAPEGTNRATMGSTPVRQRRFVFWVDCLAAERRDISDDMAAVYDLSELVEDKLDQQNSKPLFGLAGIQQFSWSGERVTILYAEKPIASIRYTLVIWVY